MTPQGKRTFRVALGEFFVIVVGVLAALAAQAFWEYRVERREEHESLLSLREEFLASHESLASGSQQWHGYATAGRGVLQSIGPDPSLPSGDSIAREVERAIVGYTTYNDHRGVLDGLIASGGLRVIQNDSLRAMLAGWPAVVDDLTEDEDLAIEFRNHELVPYVYERLPV
ncbi:MAG TPA: hypothetical protein VFQ22_11100, partial [Longimicrobiales bacterium]|nr:hypothetical protein [Longimicrobiales bacterium]